MTIDAAMTRGRHVGFATARLVSAIAHGGNQPILCERVLEGDACAVCRFVDLVEIPVGADIGLHTHDRDAEELYVIVCGTGSMRLDGDELTVRAGDVIVNRPGGSHGLRNTGDEPL